MADDSAEDSLFRDADTDEVSLIGLSVDVSPSYAERMDDMDHSTPFQVLLAGASTTRGSVCVVSSFISPVSLPPRCRCLLSSELLRPS